MMLVVITVSEHGVIRDILSLGSFAYLNYAESSSRY